MPETLEFENEHVRLREVHQALDSGMFVHVKRMLAQMRASDVALLLESSPPTGRKVLWQLTDPEHQGEILEELNEDARDGILQLMDPEALAVATENLDTDDLTYVLRSLPDSIYQEVLSQMDTQDRQRIETAMAYPEDTAGSIMNTDTITLRPDVSVDVILRYLRLKGELPEATDTLYVVDKHDKLLGAVSLSNLVTSMPSEPIAEIMDTDLEMIPVEMESEEAAKLFERHDWISAPVVNEQGHLLGRITIDDVVDIIRESTEHDMMGMANMDDDEDTFAPARQSAKRRNVWLFVNLLAALTAASVSNMFEDTLDQLATLAVLMTIVPSMGGIAGNQTLALVIRGLAVGHISQGNQKWLIGKEATVGLINGLVWALAIAVVVSVWKQDLSLGLVIAGAMFINVALAGLAGVCIPLLMKKVNIDPALAGSMALTTITDVVGLFAFLGMATLVFG